ncbi:MAG: single-stranded DNA-binding protein [bacterium]
MGSVNKVILVGNLGRDPEVRYTAAGAPIASFSLATNEIRNTKDGQKETKTEWHKIIAFGKLADICSQYLSKGKQVYVEGRLQTRSWEDKEGNKRSTTEIVANNMVMLGRAGEASADSSFAPPVEADSMSGSGPVTPEDDIPF